MSHNEDDFESLSESKGVASAAKDSSAELDAKPSERKSKRGGFRKGAGRPKRTKMEEIVATSDPYDSAATLKKLNCDPIVAAVEALKEVDLKVKWMKRQSKPSMPAIAQLMNVKRALINDLLRFGYRPVPEKIINENHEIPIGITLTDKPMSDLGLERVSSREDDDSDKVTH